MIPASQAISYYRGDTLRFYVRPQDQDGNEVDLTDYTSSFIIASDRTGTPTTLIEASTTKLGNIIECTLDSDDGELLDSSVTYQYDVTITSSDPTPVVYTYLTGTITVIDDVNGAVIPADGLGWLGDFTVTNGNLIVDRSADTTFPQIQIKAPSSSYEASLRFYDSSTLKWRIHKAATTVDLTFSSSVVGAALTLSHTTGDATFSSDVTVGGNLEVNGSYLTVDSAGGAYVDVDAAAGGGSAAAVRFQEGGSNFWKIEKAITTRNLTIQNSSSQGLTLAYSGGAATFTSDVTVGGDIELGSGGPTITTTVGSPEGVVTANSGSINIQSDTTYGSVRIKLDDGDATGWSYVPVSDGSDALNRIYYGKSAGLIGGSASFTFNGTTFTTPNVELTSGGPTITTDGTSISASSVVATPGVAPDYGVGWTQGVQISTWSDSGAWEGSSGTMWVYPIVIPVDMTIDEWAVYHATAGTDGVSRWGIWELDGTGGTPFTLVKDLGTTDRTSVGVQAMTGLNFSISAGIYGFGYVSQSITTGGGTFRRGDVAVPRQLDGNDPTQNAWTDGVRSQTGAFDSDLTSATITGVAGYGVPVFSYKRTA